MPTLAEYKSKGLCYFCAQPTPTATETVNGKPDDYKVCPDCFTKHQPEIVGARARIAQFDAMFG
jgi:hypothetical protein